MAFVLLTIASLAAGATTLLPPPPPSSPPALAAPTDLLLEMLPSPVVGMDVMRPQFAWSLPAVGVGEAASNPSRNVVQHAYQIIVVDGGTNVTLWDSGVVVSNRSSNVVYGGKGADYPPTFKAATSYTWRVKWWKDAASGSSDFSNATFLTGLLNESDWKDATFLSCASRTAPPHSPPPPPPKGQPFWSVHSLASFAGRVWLNTIFVVLDAAMLPLYSVMSWSWRKRSIPSNIIFTGFSYAYCVLTHMLTLALSSTSNAVLRPLN